MVKIVAAGLASLAFASHSLVAAQTSPLPNWVGPKIGKPIDTACYRKTILTKSCPVGYKFDNVATCWAQCPLEYPVECGMECIPQNEDCTLEIVKKVSVVAEAALKLAGTGVFGQLSAASKGVQQGLACGSQLFSIVKKLVDYAAELRAQFPQTTQEQLLYFLSKSDLAVYDLPIAITTCVGLPTPTGLDTAAQVIKVIKDILTQVLSSGTSILKPQNFVALTNQITAGASVGALTDAEIEKLKQLIGAGQTCGAQLKTVIDRISLAVQDIKKTNPTASVDLIRFVVSNSDLLLKDLPAATNECISNTAFDSFRTRDDIRKTIQIIVDRVIDASSQNGNPVPVENYVITIANLGLDAISLLDPTGIANLAKEYIQPICGPTSVLGEIDDGPAVLALGLRSMGKAFEGSHGEWKKNGDGSVKIYFESTDDQDVEVNILSGGSQIAKVPVKKDQNVTWTSTVAALQDKTLYFDRWRPGFFGIPGTGGGSLLLWAPHASTGGSLELHAKLSIS